MTYDQALGALVGVHGVFLALLVARNLFTRFVGEA